MLYLTRTAPAVVWTKLNTVDFIYTKLDRKPTSSSAIAERPQCRVGYLWPKVEDWNWETIFTNNIGLYSTTVMYMASKEMEIGEKRKIRAITPFKVIQGH